jgi:hypothetical protein
MAPEWMTKGNDEQQRFFKVRQLVMYFAHEHWRTTKYKVA